MPRPKMSDEERAAKQRERAEKRRAVREAAKATIREQITTLASQIPEHVRSGGYRQFRHGKRHSTKPSTARTSRVFPLSVSPKSKSSFACR